MGSSRSISSHCDPRTLASIDLAFDSACGVLAVDDLLARFTNDCELRAELSQRLTVLAFVPLAIWLIRICSRSMVTFAHSQT
jgi:hypothetical protein